MQQTTRQFGKQLEQRACDYLQQQGLRQVTQNYFCKMGEIDLIMRDSDNTLVFVEVRYRKSSAYGDGAESVSIFKQRKIIRAAKCYLSQHGLHDKDYCRFDVVSISNSQINWIKDAFWL